MKDSRGEAGHTFGEAYIVNSQSDPRLWSLRAKDDMAIAITELDQMQLEYKTAVEEWVTAIRREEALASVNHNVADVDIWEAAHDNEEESRDKAMAAKAAYEAALRQEFFDF
jgi:hypothetical protein